VVDWILRPVGRAPKAHIKNQAKFDLVTLRAPKDDPRSAAIITGCRGHAGELRNSSTPDHPLLYNTNLPVKKVEGPSRASFGVERIVRRK